MSIQELCEAAAAGDLHAVKKITMVDPKLVDQYEDGCNPLHNAASSGHLSIVEHLIEQCHANVNSHKIRAAQQDPWTALDYAASNGHLPIVQYLIEKARAGSKTAPVAAAKSGHLSVVEYLIENFKGSDLHMDVEVITMLHSATRNGHLSSWNI